MFKLKITLLFSIMSIISGFDLHDYSRFVIEELATNQTVVAAFKQHLDSLLQQEPNYFDYMPANFEFKCSPIDDGIKDGRTVNQLRPQDIKVVGGLGDSLSAALGENADTIFGLLLEYRGRSFSMGGDQDVNKLVTLPNILREFNSNLYGASKGVDIAIFNEDGVGLNAAVSGQEANHIAQQASVLVSRMRADKRVNFTQDWKLVNVFIGGNDLCRFCQDGDTHKPENYIKDIANALDILYKEVPKVFVNLITVLNVDDVKLLNKGLICILLHHYGCECAAFPKNQAQEDQLKTYIEQYQTFTDDLVNSGRYEGRDDFTVVVQPFLRDFRVPLKPDGEPDLTFFAPDCFHFSTKGHTTASVGLWNNMLEPIGKKSTAIDPNETLLCPTKEKPYFFTRKNSN